MASPPFQMRLSPEQRARWQAAAGAGVSLATFVKDAVEEKIARDAREPGIPPQVIRLPQPEFDATAGGKVFKGPDPKGGK